MEPIERAGCRGGGAGSFRLPGG